MKIAAAERTAIRYDSLAEEADWQQVIAIDEPLRSWLDEERKAVQSI